MRNGSTIVLWAAVLVLAGFTVYSLTQTVKAPFVLEIKQGQRVKLKVDPPGADEAAVRKFEHLLTTLDPNPDNGTKVNIRFFRTGAPNATVEEGPVGGISS